MVVLAAYTLYGVNDDTYFYAYLMKSGDRAPLILIE
jgi:hypothetical protein